MAQDQAFSLPVHLRRCLVDRVTGKLSLLGHDGSLAATIAFDGGCIVDIEAPALARTSVGTSEENTRSILGPLFELPDMRAAFDRGAPGTTTNARLLITDALLEGIKRTKDSERVSRWLGNREDVLQLGADPYERFSESSLGPSEGFFLSRIERPMSVQAMLDDASADPDLALRMVCAMRYAGVLVPTTANQPWIGDRAPFASQAGTDDLSSAADGAGSDDLAQAFYLVEEKLRTVQSGADPYAILEVERRANADRIKANYRHLAKIFHPDRHAQLAAFDDDIKSRLEVIFTALTQAYSILGNAKEREAYDAKRHKTDHDAGLKSPQPQPAPPPPAPVVQPAPPPVAESKVARGPVRPPIPIPVVAPLPRRPKPAAKSKKASPSDAATREARQEPAPQEHVPIRPSPSPGPAPKPTVQPDALYDHGMAYAEAGDWERAVQALMRGTAAAPDDARMHAKLGAALAALHGLDKLAEASLRKSLELDSSSAERYVEIGEVYLRFDRPEEARTLFKRAFLLDSDNAEARSALRKMGVHVASSDAPAGFFKKLFRKS